jgi:hypothetical protein
MDSEASCEPACEAAVSAFDPEGVEASEARAGLGEHRGVEVVGRMGARDLDTRLDRLAHRGRDGRAGQRVGDAPA